MEKKTLALLLISLVALLASFALSFLQPMNNTFVGLPLTVLVLAFFLFGVVGFGFLSFVPHIFLGLAMGAQKNATIFIFLAPIILATFAGIKLGTSLLDDMQIKKYFLEEWKTILLPLVIALALAITIEFTLPIIIQMQLWPEDLLGMNMQEGTNVYGLLQELKAIGN